ncbi:MAG: enoyl-CoA hydratase [Acidimicrobiales bacterium]|jgi:enoyl-CoA hydratase|nr:enoyl-CoA hydratase [Acidimicrobiales bacterium]
MAFVEISNPRPHVALIRLNRPERMNAMSFDVMVPFREAMEAVGRDNDTRVCVITGVDRGFCSGADLEDSGAPPNIDGLKLSGISLRAMEYLSDLVPAMRAMPQPVIAAVNGAAVGGGMCLSLGADIRYASESAYFRAAGINNGLTATELGVSFLLPRAIGASRAFEILLTGRDVDAWEAERIGLVSKVVPDAELLDACYETAARIVEFSRVGVQLTKQVLWSGLETASLEAAINHENRSQLHVRLTTRNFDEAIRARKEGRKPVFED